MLLKEALEFFMRHGNVCGPLYVLGLEKPTRAQIDTAVACARRDGQPEAACVEAATAIETYIGIRDSCQDIGVSDKLAKYRERQRKRPSAEAERLSG